MRLTFNYKSDFFEKMLWFSILVHLGIGSISSFGQRPATFGVIQAPLSVDVVMIEQAIPLQPVIQEKPIEPIAKQAAVKVETPIIERIIPIEKSKSEDQMTIVEEDMKGAAAEAAPEAIKNPAPTYPYIARREAWEGEVTVKVFVEKDGLPQSVLVEKSSGYGVLDDAAVRTIQRWHFTAARRGYSITPSQILIPIRFQLIDG